MIKKADLNGKWQSKESETLKNPDGTVMYIKREAVFSEDSWEILIKTFMDEAAEVPLFTVRANGSYKLGEESDDVPSATCVDFENTARYVTPNNGSMAEMLNHAAVGKVGWKVNVEQDVSKEGCFLVPSIENCPVEYDLLKIVTGEVEREELYFGDYTPEQREDMQKASKNSKNGFEASQGICAPENRPQTLIEFPLLRV
ncbi:hypothetical protein DSECCO2_32740 [anaerobic digester metagenome]|nr:hypothetical protein [Methanobacterium aggregans]MBP2045550.1 hypothetical protein [Methanobacterium aggregans]